MKQRFLVGFLLCFLTAAAAFGQNAALQQASQLELQGRFKETGATIQTALQRKNLAPVERKQLEFELDRLDRIKKDFPFTKSELFIELKNSVKGLTPQEFEQWVGEGRFDSREIDGERYFMSASVSNLFFRYPELNPRRLPWKNTAALEKRHWETAMAIEASARVEGKPYVLPKRFQVNLNVTAKADAAPPGEIVRAWLPIPRECPFQNGFELLDASPGAKHLDDPSSTIRSVLMEQPAQKNKPTKFNLDFEYTTRGVWFDLKPDQVKPGAPGDSALKPYTQEAPHVVFTPEIRALSQQIVGSETNPCVAAKRIFDWIGDNIKYSYAIEYSTIRNISDYCLSHGYGDCGQEAFLFITLCRLNGIPARWQTGWNTFPGAKDIHDWSEIYLAPYGWVPVDPYMSVYATRYATSLTPEQRRQLRDFYFGGLDQYRMIANSDHNQTLNPPKQSMRSDNVDFQRGELEWGNHNLYFDQYSYEFIVKEVKPGRGRLD